MARARVSHAKHFKWEPFSLKQLMALTWWVETESNPWASSKIMIADGSIRSGKTISVVDSFITWSLDNFEGEQFAIVGQSMGAIRKNVLEPLFKILAAKGIAYRYNKSDNIVTIGSNVYLLYGAPNDSSQNVLQGVTLAGAMADEVALLPRNFVDQLVGRCSVEGSRLFMTCNPKGPHHWFKTEFIDQRAEKNILYLHFTMDDNPSLSAESKAFFKSMFTGVFYARNVLGLWVLSEGLIFDAFDEKRHVVELEDVPSITRQWIGIDQGFGNATVFLHQGLGTDGRCYVLHEYYHSARNKELYIDGIRQRGGTAQKSPLDYAKDLTEFMAFTQEEMARHTRIYKVAHKTDMDRIIIDPAAKGFINQCSQAGIKKIAKAQNDVNPGIEFVATLLTSGNFRILSHCTNTIKGFAVYAWDQKAQDRGEDKPIKKDDDAMDANRYGCYTQRRYFKDIFKGAA